MLTHGQLNPEKFTFALTLADAAPRCQLAFQNWPASAAQLYIHRFRAGGNPASRLIAGKHGCSAWTPASTGM